MKIVAGATDDGEQVINASAGSRKGSAELFSQGAVGGNRFGIFW
jgi:hypothetical protein